MNRKERYEEFCTKEYVQIYSQPWWLDVVCGSENWDVWLYESGGRIDAAMPYYMEQRGAYRYITKAPCTQTNGIVFARNKNARMVTIAQAEDKIIQEACKYIKSLELDVYEQQYPYTFTNWQPFYWNNYTCIVRYTYVVDQVGKPEDIMRRMTATYRNALRKGLKLVQVSEDLSKEEFYLCNNKVFEKQGKKNPLDQQLWYRIYDSCEAHNCGKIVCAKDEAGNVHAIAYYVWDDESIYLLFGGYMPEYSSTQAYPVLIYHGMCMAGERGLRFDFEGSMIRQVARAMREYGGTPMPYYRIRKVFNPQIVRQEAEQYIRRLEDE
ncbi:MAG: GNAT family N-acetyltransferase [Lachnospiraceae bacterium]|nr:GNAT family N-acetyltransferase [Lachnospiraceae bacterium]